MASWTAVSSACMRVSNDAPCGGAGGTITFHPSSLLQFSHWGASDGSMTAMAGVPDGVDGARTGIGRSPCARASSPPSRLIMPQASANLFGQFLNVVGLLQSGHGNHGVAALFDLLLQFLRQLRQFRRVFDVLLVLGFEDLFFLRLAVGLAIVLLRLQRASSLRDGGTCLTMTVRDCQGKPDRQGDTHNAAAIPKNHGIPASF